MSGFNTTRLPATVRVIQSAPLSLASELQEEIQKIWSDAVAIRPKLFNGIIYILTDHRDDALYIAESEYKLSFALQKNSNIFSGLSINLLAVTGLLFCKDGLILGRRSRTVTSQNGLWEPAPAGSLSCLDPRAQVLEELEEELGITGDKITKIECKGLITDLSTNIADIIFELKTDQNFDSIKSRIERHKNDEYDAICCVKTSDLKKFLSENQGNFIPILPEALKLTDLI